MKIIEDDAQTKVNVGAIRALYQGSRERYEDSLFEFVRAAWPYIDSSTFQSCWAIEAFCEHLQAVTLGYIPRLLANYPPRASKTSVASICWPAWTWARSEKTFLSGPQVRFLCASYNDELSLMSATKMRRLILSPWYQKFWGSRFMLSADQSAKSNFENTAGGARIATSVRGSLLGLGGDCVCVDDPANAESEKVIETDADRKRVAGWWKELSGTRLNDPKKSAIVVVMQRLHQEDLSGIILDGDEKGEWSHLCIPMHYDSGRHCVTVKLPHERRTPPPEGEVFIEVDNEPWEDPRTIERELMWPERFGETEIKRMEAALGPYLSSGRLEQLPSPKGGGIIKDIWWRTWDQEEAQRYGLEWHGARKEFPQFELIIASLDTNFGVKEENDFNALTIWGIWTDSNKNRRAMMAFAWNKRLQLHGEEVSAWPGETEIAFRQRQKESWGLVEWVADTCRRYKVRRLLIENKARGYDVANEINRLYRREQWGVELIDPVGDKVSRGHSIVPLFVDGVVWAPDTQWAQEVITQCSLVPKAAHDDMYDTCLCGDTGIVTSRGIVPISEVNCGDLVMTHKGRWRAVTGTGSRISDHYFKLKAKGFEEIRITGEHPALVMRVRAPQNASREAKEICWKKVSDLQERPTYTFSRNGKKVKSRRRVYYDALVIPQQAYILSFSENVTSKAIVSEGYIGTHIEHNERIEESVTVYNLSVQGDESYVTVGGAVHNCTMFLHWAREQGILERADEMTAAIEEESKLKPTIKSVAQAYGV